MGVILNKTLERGVAKGYFTEAEVEPARQKIEQLASKYGFNADDFAILTHVESYGMNPRADKIPTSYNNSCTGIIQFCQDFKRTDGIKTIKGRQLHTKSILRLSLQQQLELVDDYFSETVGRVSNPGLVDLYLSVLLPSKVGVADGVDISGATGTQAAVLYVDGDRSKGITRSSLDIGLRKIASNNLNVSFDLTQTDNTANINLSSRGINANSVGLFSGIFDSGCLETFPVEGTFDEAKRYPGCKSRIAQARFTGNNLSQPAIPMQALGPSDSFILGNPRVPENLKPGSLIWPFAPAANFPPSNGSGVFLNDRGSHFHAGIDIAVAQGTDTLAVGDGVIIPLKIRPGGYGGTIDLLLDNHNGVVVRYAHMLQSAPVGTRIKQGQIIGKSGGRPGTPGAGSSTGPHLHIELRLDGGAGGSFKSIAVTKQKCLDPILYLVRA